MVEGWRLIAVTEPSDFAPVSSNELFNIQTSKDCGFNLKFVRDMKKTSSQIDCEDKYSHLSSIIWCLW